MSNQLNIHYNTVKKYLPILTRFNLLNIIDGEHKKEYLINQEMFDFIQIIIDEYK